MIMNFPLSTMTRNANPFQTYFERDLHCFWKNNVKTLRFQKLYLYQ